MDRKQLDDIHVMTKIITEDGDSLLLFLGFSEQTERGTEGYYKAAQDAIKNWMDWKALLELILSKTGFCAKISREKIKVSGIDLILKLWCAVH